ncbi:Trm112 family protein [Hoeflea sp. YIM 152468]|uniref:Trm112 family protein n=1 Tax=Hoeflea sp. YIM 152468 TaxID=3031759 RepID=UPI0023DBD918|nr:Trm112 family protein [Hoeflea sp. YIM 152468]MDF1608241.1 Trm112 family protein [Hoeflea sp. YIM 152468]
MTDQIPSQQTIRSAGAVDVKMLELLVCPLTYGPLKFDADKTELVSGRARLAYPVRDGIPIMLVSEARQLPDDD